jgi:hypothetical protein
MEWSEPLPKFCPPEDATHPSNGSFYRLIESDEPSEIDFYSHRLRWPNKTFHVNECRARSLSVFDALGACEKLRLLPTHRNKKIIEMRLPEDCGVIKQIGNDVHHFSWWRYKSFNPLNHCKIALS